MNAARLVFFKEEYSSAEATKWMLTWSAAEKKKATLFVYSVMKTKNKYIVFKLFVEDSVLGEQFSYKKGQEMIAGIV